MFFLSKLKRKLQWRGEHFLEALAEQDMNKRMAILHNFMKYLHTHGVPEKLIHGNENEFEKYIIKQATTDGKKTIYEYAETLGGELKAPR